MQWIKRHPSLVFVAVLMLLSLAYGYVSLLGKGPHSLHSWRQADCLSITSNYYEDDLPFLEPAVNWTGQQGHGKTISEFPILYYSVAQIWKVIGKHEFVSRLLNMLLVYLGLLFLFKTARQHLQDDFWAGFVAIVLFTSPLLAYYTNNFIANTPAFGLALCALHFVWKYYQTFQIRHFYIACGLFALAGLLKITALLSFAAIVPLHLYVLLKRDQFSIGQKLLHLAPFGLVLIIIPIWYAYAGSYNSANNAGIFLQGILPIWELPGWEIKTTMRKLYHELVPRYFNLTALIAVGFGLLYTLINYKKANAFLLALSLFTIGGSGLYLLLFFQVFDVHDYYLINLLVVLPIVMITVLDLIKRMRHEVLQARQTKLLATVALLGLSYSAAVQNRLLINSDSAIVKSSPLISNQQQDLWNWTHFNYNNTLKALETLEPKLRAAGINRDDLVISVPDGTINVSLYLMNQKGFSDFGYGGLEGIDRIERFKEIGAKYLIVNDSSIVEERGYQRYTQHPVLQHQNVTVYQLD